MDDKKRIRDVIYPEIKQCEDYITDVFWKKLFDDMSRGKCPKNIVIFNNTVSSVYKRNGFIYDFRNKDPETIAKDLVEILKTNGCIYSLSDLKKEQKDSNDNNNNIKYDSWKQIKTRKIRQQYIHNFVLKQSQKYKLNDSSSKNLINMINLALNEFKTHKSDDVEFKNNEITNIKDIYYDNKFKCFVNCREFEDKEDIKRNINPLKKGWESFIIKSYREFKQILK